MRFTLTRNVVMACSIVALCALVVGCSGSGDDTSADLQRQLDMANDQLAGLQTQVEELMGRGDISPEDLAMLQAQIETLMGRADISPDYLATLQAQTMSMQRQLDEAAKRAMRNRIGDTASWYHTKEGTAWLANQESRSSGSRYASISQSYRAGSLGGFLAWYDVGGNLGIEGGEGLAHTPLQRNPDIWPYRVFRTSILDRNIDGVTASHRPIENHGLGAEWQGLEAIKTYDGGGTLTLRFFTDLEQSDNPGNPYVGHPADDASYPNIILDGVPAVPAEWEGMWVFPDGLRGSLDGVAGTFSCDYGTYGYCGLETGRHHLAPGYTPDVTADPVIFTPDDGSGAEELSAPRPLQVPTANYLSFGNWMFVPEDITDTDAFNFGVFAGGDDPFVLDNIMGLIGTADYAGEASGMYAETLPSGRTIGTFDAKVQLTADFGTVSDYGKIGGKVYEFQLDSGNTPPLTELTLLTQFWRDGTGASNIFPSWADDSEDGLGADVVGGWIESNTRATGTDGRKWIGVWGGKFFGNGAAPGEHPTSVAGTFGATAGDYGEAGRTSDNFTLAGSFGAHMQ